jgi:hypothetical protein
MISLALIGPRLADQRKRRLRHFLWPVAGRAVAPAIGEL